MLRRFLNVYILSEDVDADLLPPVGQVGICRTGDDWPGKGLTLAGRLHVFLVAHFAELTAPDEFLAEHVLIAQAPIHAGKEIMATKPVVIVVVEVDRVFSTHGSTRCSEQYFAP